MKGSTFLLFAITTFAWLMNLGSGPNHRTLAKKDQGNEKGISIRVLGISGTSGN